MQTAPSVLDATGDQGESTNDDLFDEACRLESEDNPLLAGAAFRRKVEIQAEQHRAWLVEKNRRDAVRSRMVSGWRAVRATAPIVASTETAIRSTETARPREHRASASRQGGGSARSPGSSDGEPHEPSLAAPVVTRRGDLDPALELHRLGYAPHPAATWLRHPWDRMHASYLEAARRREQVAA